LQNHLRTIKFRRLSYADPIPFIVLLFTTLQRRSTVGLVHKLGLESTADVE